MLTSDLSVFSVGLLFGAALLFFGLAAGWWLGHKSFSLSQGEMADETQLVHLLRGLFQWTDGFSSEVSGYREALDRLGKRCREVSGQTGVGQHEGVVKLLSQMIQANERVQTRLAKAEAALQDQAKEIASYVSEARTDTLTGLPNRRAFDDELTRRMAEWRHNRRPVSVLLLDIDHFKQFNDQHGHLAGDTVLAETGRILRQNVHESDLVARFGGEEFAVILPGCETEGAPLAVERVRRAVEQNVVHFEKTTLRVTISLGVAQAEPGEAISSLIRRADEAMYASKAAGRNCGHLHDGRRCLQVAKRPVAALDPVPDVPLPRPMRTDPEEFRQVCDGVRERLLSVVGQDAANEC